MHLATGECLGHLYGAEVQRVAVQLATHFERGRDFVRAIDYLIEAAAKARAQFASVTAAEHYSHALSLAERIAPERQGELRAALYHKRASAHFALGRMSEAEQDFSAM